MPKSGRKSGGSKAPSSIDSKAPIVPVPTPVVVPPEEAPAEPMPPPVPTPSRWRFASAYCSLAFWLVIAILMCARPNTEPPRRGPSDTILTTLRINSSGSAETNPRADSSIRLTSEPWDRRIRSSPFNHSESVPRVPFVSRKPASTCSATVTDADRVDVLLAQLSYVVHCGVGTDKVHLLKFHRLTDGWTLWDSTPFMETIPDMEYDPLQFSWDDVYGLRMCIYAHHSLHQARVVIRGTYEGNDWYNNAAFAFSLAPPSWVGLTRLLEAEDSVIRRRMQLLADAGYEVTFVGHSLGAGLAELSACHFGLSATTFDSPGTAWQMNYTATSRCFCNQHAPPLTYNGDPDKDDLTPTNPVTRGLPISKVTIAEFWLPVQQIRTFLSVPGNPVHFAGPQAGCIIQSNQIGAYLALVRYASSLFGVCLVVSAWWLSRTSSQPTLAHLMSPQVMVLLCVLSEVLHWCYGSEDTAWTTQAILFGSLMGMWLWSAMMADFRLALFALAGFSVHACAWYRLHSIDLFVANLLSAQSDTRVDDYAYRSKSFAVRHWIYVVWLVFLVMECARTLGRRLFASDWQILYCILVTVASAMIAGQML